MQEGSLFSIPSTAFVVYRLFDDGHSDWCEVIPYCSLDVHISTITVSDVEHFFMGLLAIRMFSMEKCLMRSSVPFFFLLIGLFVFKLLNCLSVC